MKKCLFLCILSWLPMAQAQQNDPALRAGFEPRFGAVVPRETLWFDERGETVTLADALGERPTLLVLAYYHCPMLCPRVLQHLAATIGQSDLRHDLHVVAASIDPRDKPQAASWARDQFVQRANAPLEMATFLTGPENSSRSLADAVGIRYAYDADHGEYAHPAVLILIDREGRVARYLPALTTTPRDLRLALTELNAVRRASVWDHALLLCYAYDPRTGRYTLAITSILRFAGAITVFLLIVLFWRLHKRGAS